MKTKKLVYILNHYSKKSPSHFNHVFNLLEELASNDIYIYLVIEKAEDLPTINNPKIYVYVQKYKIFILRFFELFFKLLELNKIGYNTVFIRISKIAGIVAVLVKGFKKIKVYYWLSGQGFMESYNEKKGFSKLIDYLKNILPFNLIVKGVSTFVTGPESMGKYFSAYCNVPSNKINILYNDINPNRFYEISIYEKSIIKDQLRIDKNKIIILFAHRFSPVRKTTLYIPYIIDDLIKYGNNFLLIFLGSGPDLNEVKNLFENSILNKNVIFLGDIPNSEIQQYYQVSDIFINPTFSEGFPRVLLEAMACGLPIVTTDAGGINDIMGNKQKVYMSDKNEFSKFSKNLINLLNSTPAQKDLIIENKLQVQKFYTSTVAKMYVKVLFD